MLTNGQMDMEILHVEYGLKQLLFLKSLYSN